MHHLCHSDASLVNLPLQIDRETETIGPSIDSIKYAVGAIIDCAMESMATNLKPICIHPRYSDIDHETIGINLRHSVDSIKSAAAGAIIDCVMVSMVEFCTATGVKETVACPGL